MADGEAGGRTGAGEGEERKHDVPVGISSGQALDVWLELLAVHGEGVRVGYLLSTFSALILTVTLPFCRGICLYS